MTYVVVDVASSTSIQSIAADRAFHFPGKYGTGRAVRSHLALKRSSILKSNVKGGSKIPGMTSLKHQNLLLQSYFCPTYQASLTVLIPEEYLSLSS